MAKDELMEKPGGVKKRLYDYSIDLIGPGERATQQLKLGEQTGVPIHVLSMAEETFEGNLLPHIPCMDRWVARAEAMASCGAESVYVWQMGPYDAASSAEINKFFWWEPVPDPPVAEHSNWIIVYYWYLGLHFRCIYCIYCYVWRSCYV